MENNVNYCRETLLNATIADAIVTASPFNRMGVSNTPHTTNYATLAATWRI